LRSIGFDGTSRRYRTSTFTFARILRRHDDIFSGNGSDFRTERRRASFSSRKCNSEFALSVNTFTHEPKDNSGAQMRTLYIIIGAAIGAPTRFAVDQYIKKFTSAPYGVFLVNIIGSFIIGLTFKESFRFHDLIAIGFAGAFTTWSTFMLDIYLAYELKRYREVALNLTLSLAAGIAAAWCGLQLVS
jgi:CrcB protein